MAICCPDVRIAALGNLPRTETFDKLFKPDISSPGNLFCILIRVPGNSQVWWVLLSGFGLNPKQHGKKWNNDSNHETNKTTIICKESQLPVVKQVLRLLNAMLRNL